MHTTIRSHVKKCRSCQTNKRRKLKYGKLPTKIVIMTSEVVILSIHGAFMDQNTMPPRLAHISNFFRCYVTDISCRCFDLSTKKYHQFYSTDHVSLLINEKYSCVLGTYYSCVRDISHRCFDASTKKISSIVLECCK